MSEEEQASEEEQEYVKFAEIAINGIFESDGVRYKRIHQKGCCGRKKRNAVKLEDDSAAMFHKHQKVIKID